MKKLLSIVFSLFFLITSCKKKVLKKKNASTASKNVSVLEKEFVIKGLNSVSHKIWLYLPPNYETSTDRFPVIYMHDGQNLFDKKTSFTGEWEIDETLNKLFKETGKGFIVVGIENGGEKRIEKYTPYQHEKYGGGKGDFYVDFLANELKPYIDSNYRTKINANNTAIIGSSLGGLISFYGGLKHPNIFGKIGALSSSLWFSDKINDFTKQNGSQKNTKICFLVGAKEGDTMVPDTENMAKLLINVGFPANNLKTKIVTEGKHNEAFWRTEFLEVITFLYNL